MTAGKPVIKVTAGEWQPFVHYKLLPDGTTGLVGPMSHLMDILAHYLDFEYEIVRAPNGVWGNKQPNGSWTGMLGQIQRQEVEFGLGPFTVSPLRATVCHFSVPVHHENWAIMTPRPGLSNDVTGFLKPFTTQVWLLTLASLVSVSTTMACMVWAEAKIFRVPAKNIVSKALLWVLTTLTQESSEWLPKKDGGRLIVTTWLLASFVFMTSYSGILTAMLMAPWVTIPIDSLADLVSQSDLPWRLEGGSFMRTFIRESDLEVHQKAYRGQLAPLYECFLDRQDVIEGKYAAFCAVTAIQKSMAEDFSMTAECHLYMTRETVLTNTLTSLAFTKNSSYLSKVNDLLQLILEAGLWDKWLGDQLANASHCLRHPKMDRRGEGLQPINMESFFGPLLVLLSGSGVGLMAFLSEHLVRLWVQPSQPDIAEHLGVTEPQPDLLVNH